MTSKRKMVGEFWCFSCMGWHPESSRANSPGVSRTRCAACAARSARQLDQEAKKPSTGALTKRAWSPGRKARALGNLMRWLDKVER